MHLKLKFVTQIRILNITTRKRNGNCCQDSTRKNAFLKVSTEYFLEFDYHRYCRACFFSEKNSAESQLYFSLRYVD